MNGHGVALRVLIVEHEPADAELCEITLRQGGFDVRVDVASTLEELRALLDEKAFDVVLADYRLPGWSGMDALAELRARGLSTPFILVTGTLGDERAIECIREGAADYVVKDHMARLPQTVRRALEDERARAERRRAEDLIRKLTLAVDQSPAAVLITDAHGIIEYVNRRFTEASGFTWDEAIGSTPRILRSGLTPNDVYADLWKTIREGKPWRGEVRNRRKGGELYWDSVTITPLRDSSGQVTHFLATQEDVTARKQAEDAMRASEEQLRLILESTAEGIFGLDREGLCTFCNPAAARLLGLQGPEALVGNDVHALTHHTRSDGTPYPAEECRILRVARTGVGVHSEDELFWRGDGTSFPVEYSSNPILSRGKLIGSVVAFVDVTQRRLAQAALAESEARFRKLIEASFDAIDITQDGVIVDGNPGLAELFGYSLDEMIGRPVTDFLAEESREMVVDRMSRGIEGQYELVGKRKDGRKIRIEATARMHKIQGRPARVTALRDVSELRLLEEQFRQAQKMEAIGRLAGGVAHDFNNLLTIITSYADVLLEEMGPNDPRREDMSEIRKAAEGATALTRQLLTFSRQQVIQPRVVELEEVVDDTQKLLGRLVGEDITLVSALSNEPSLVTIDPTQLEQIIMNLAVNSRDAMPMGGKLTIETAQLEMTSDLARTHWPAFPGRYALLALSDTGVGMDEATKARIFEPFFTTKELGKGTGLGLATVYGIVKQAHGFIWVYSEPGHGTTFKIYLPLAVNLERAERAAASAEPSTGSGETVLVVEDADGVRSVVRQILERYGYQVLEAPSAEVALRFARERAADIDLLLTDVVMPEMGGRELAQRFSALCPRAKVLYMSGYTDESVVRHGVLAAGIAFLQKPFTPATLARKVREVLDAGDPPPS
jgi:PAS domain S-box-containing protein